MIGGLGPRGSGPLWDERIGHAAEQIGVGTSCCESETDTNCSLDDTRCDFQQPEPDCIELSRCQITNFRNGVAYGEDEPIGCGVEDEADLIGERRAAAGAVGGELGLVQLRFSACPRAQ